MPSNYLQKLHQIALIYLNRAERYRKSLHLKRRAEHFYLLMRKHRTELYLLPFLIQWLPGITFERDPKLIRSANRAMVLFFLYLAATLALLFLSNLSSGTSFHLIGAYFIFFFHLAAWGAYFGVSIFLARKQYLNELPDSLILDTWAAEFRKFLSR